ncbi:hypothetical protein QCA50_016908 [Cerrena zonata]|uniref:F-box domain-containing protein n=1 Tax=Cerrena zonata TaxID=2478898 RepID=A0AAW0FRP6_9APHY
MERPDETVYVCSRTGSLQDLPLDILFGIIGHLNPGDLLNLSRISKPFRDLLISPDSSFLWRDSRKNVPHLPGRPSFLSEPAYANLLFDYHCHNCLRAKVRVVYWEVGARYCSNCGETFFHNSDSIQVDLISFNENALFPIPDELISDIYNNSTALFRHKPTIEKLKKQWAGLVSDDQCKEAINEYRIWKDERIEFAQACKAWQSRCKDELTEKRRQMRKDKMEEVGRRLEKLGYGEDFKFSNRFYSVENHPLWKIPHIKQSKPWTDGAWKKMEGKILEVMDIPRTERFFEIRKTAIKPRAQLLEDVLVPWRLSVGIVSPHTRNLLLIPEVRSLIDVPPNGKGSEAIPVTREDLEKLEPVFYRYLREWKQEQLETIAKLVSVSFELPLSTGLFSLAVSQYFLCSACCDTIAFPDVLLHRCLHGQRPSYWDHKDTYESVIINLTYSSKMPTLECIVLADDLQDVIVACGQDPRTATADEMDALDVRLECIPCQSDGVFDAFNWRQAWKHYRFTHNSYYHYRKPPSWRQVASTYLPLIKELESNLISNSNVEREKQGWFCAHCPKMLNFDSWYCFTKYDKYAELISHLTTVHITHDPTGDDHYSNPWWVENYATMHYVSLIWQTPVSRQLQFKLAKGEAKIIDLLTGTVPVNDSSL